MNHVYRIVWRATLGTWVAVAETALGQGKSSKAAKPPATRPSRRGRGVLRAMPLLGLVATAGAFAQSAVVAPGGQTNVYVAPNGVTVVNIAGANGAGLSHNRYQQFNVDPKGLVLNNTSTAQIQYQSQLAGQVMANYNIATPAKVILNEVVANNRSQLAGYTEVLGGRADVVIANPYGITCGGCGFINTDRVTLTTGLPNLRADGSLGGFSVNQGDILIQGSGLNGTPQQVLDLVTRSVKIDGQVNTQDLGIFTGANTWDYGTRSVSGAAAASGTAPVYAIDSSALGGMYANRIRLVATEAGVGVRMLGNAAASGDDFSLSAAGRIELTGNQVSAQRDVLLASSDPSAAAVALTNASVTAARNASLQAGPGGLSLDKGMVVAGADLQAIAARIDASAGARLQAGGALTASTTAGAMNLGAAAVRAGSTLALKSADAVRTASADGQGVQSTGGDVVIEAATGLFNDGVVSADAAALTVRAGNTVDNGGTLSAATAVDVADAAGGASAAVGNRGTVIAGGDLRLQGAALDNSGWLQAGGSASVAADTLDNSGHIVALGGDATLRVDQRMLNTGKVQAARNIALSSRSDGAVAQLDNRGEMRAIGAMDVQAVDLINSGSLVSGTATQLDAAQLSNTGDIYTDGQLTVLAGALVNSADLLAGGSMKLAAGTLENTATGWIQAAQGSTVTTTGDASNAGTWLLSQQAGASDSVQVGGQMTNSGTLQSAGSLDASAGTLANSGAIAAAGALQLGTQGRLDNTGAGVLQAGGSLGIDAGGAVTNARNAVMTGTALAVRGAQGLTNDGLLLASAGDAQLRVSGTLDNRGRIQASDAMDIADANGSTSQALVNSGWIQADGSSTVRGDSLANTGVWLLSTQAGSPTSSIIVNGDLINGDGSGNGVLQAYTNATLGVGNTLDNRAGALLRTGGALQIGTSGSVGVDNAGTVQAGSTLGMNGTGALHNAAGATLLGDQLQVAMGSIDNRGAIQGGASAASSVRANGTLANQAGGVITIATSAKGGGTVAGGTLTNEGTLQSLGDLALQMGSGGLSNTGDGSTDGRIVADGNIALAATGTNAYSATIGGMLQSGGTLTVTGNAASTLDVDGTASSGGKVDIDTGTVNIAAQGVLAGQGDLDIDANSLTLAVQGSGTTAKTGRILAALGGAGAGNIHVSSAFTNNGLLFSAHDLNVRAPSITVGATAAISALHDLLVHANGGRLDLSGAAPAGNAGNLDNSGLLYAGHALTAKANGTLTNGVGAGGSVSTDMQINSDGSLDLVANTLVNNTLINAGGDITIVAANFHNEIAGGDTRNVLSDTPRYNNGNVPIAGAWEVDYRDDGAGQNKDKAWKYEYRYTDAQSYGSALPSLVPQITAGNNLKVYFHDGKNLAATMYAGNQLALQGFSVDPAQADPNAHAALGIADDLGHGFKLEGGSFLNDNLALETRTHTVFYSLTTKLLALGPATDYENELCSTTGGGKWDAVCFTDGVNDTYTSVWSSPANAGLFARQLFAAGTALINRGPTGPSTDTAGTGGADLSSRLSGQAPASTADGRAAGQGAAVGAATTVGRALGGGLTLAADPGFSTGRPLDGKSYLNDNATNGVSGTSFGGIDISLPGNPNGYFVQSLDASARYLVETNPLYLSGGATVGSDYLTQLLGYSPDQIGLRLGDAAYESWLVKQQLIKQTGTAVLASYANADSQMKDMMEHAASQSSTLGLVYGKALSPAQQASLKEDIVWMVQTQIEGKTVLTPVVYLAQGTKAKIATGAVISAQDANLSVASLTNTGGTLIGSNSLVVASTGDISNLSGLIQGGNVSLTSTEGSIVNKTLSQESGGKSVYTTQLGKTAGIESTGNLSLEAKKDITNLGANVTAGGNATLKAGNDITFDTIEKKDTTTTSGKVDHGFSTTTTSTTTQVKSGLTVGGSLDATAANDITLAGTDAKVGGNASLEAGNNVNIVARENSSATHSQTNSSGFGQNNSLYSSTTTTTDSTSIRNVGSTFEVGGDATLKAKNDITVQGSSVDVKGSGDLQATNVNVLAGRNYDETSTTTKTSGVMQVSAGSGKSKESSASAGATSGRGLASAAAGASGSASGQGSAGLAFSSTTTTTDTSTDLTHVGSTLNFGKDLNVKATQDVNLQGSTINAGGNATVAATNVNLLAAEDVHTTSSTSTTTRVGLMASTDNKVQGQAGASASAQGGKGTPGASAQASAGATATSENKVDLVQREESSSTTRDTKNQGSAINAGGNLAVTATDTLTLQGSSMSSGGNMDLQAKDMKFLAAEDKHEATSSSSKTTAGLYADAKAQGSAQASADVGLGAQAGAKVGGSAGVEVGLYGSNTTAHSTEGSTTAVTSSLKSGGDINRTASNNITDVGTQIEGAGNLNQSAQSIDSIAARNTTYSSADSTTHTAKIGAYAEAGAEASAQAQVGPNASQPKKEGGGGAGVRASYEYDNSTSSSSTSQAVTSSIKMGGSVNSTSSGKTTMEGTQIQAGQDVNLSASALDYQAAKNTATSSSSDKSANASVNVDILKKEVGASVGYEGNKSSASSSTAVVGGISAGGNLNVKTTGDARFEGTHLTAGGGATVDAGGNVKFDAAKNTASSHSEGQSVDVSASGGKSGGAAAAAVGVSKSNYSLDQDVAGSITSGSGPLTIKSGGDASFTGTQIASSGGDVTVAAGGNINMKVARTVEHSDALGVDVSASGAGGKATKGGTRNATTGKKSGGTEVDQRSGAASLGVATSKSDSNTASAGSITSGAGAITLSSGGNTRLEGTQVSAATGIGVSTGGSFEMKDAVSTRSSSTVGVSASASGSSQTPRTKGTAQTAGAGQGGTASPAPAPAPAPATPPAPAPKPKPAPAPGGTGGTGGTGATSKPPAAPPPLNPAQQQTLNQANQGTGAGSNVTGGANAANAAALTQKGGSGVASVYVDNQSSTTAQAATLNGGSGAVVVQQGVKPATTGARPAVTASVPLVANAPKGSRPVATLSDGKPLPAWLKFDAATGKLQGTPPPDFKGEVKVQVKVPQADGSTRAVPVVFGGQ